MTNGQKFGRYEIKEEIGRGGMATVYRAYDPQLDLEVALKVIREDASNDAKFRDRFTQEAKTLISLHHSAIVPIYHFGEEDGKLYFVTRYMRGGSLRDRLMGKPMSLKETNAILQRIAAALERAHERGIIHRDIKPHNVLIDETGEASLSDFGVAREILAETGEQKTVTLIGTPHYMAPEQLLEGIISTRTDIYQLGVLVFQMVTGKLPFTANTPLGLIQKHLNDTVPLGSEINTNLPSTVDAVLQKALAKRPSDRYPSALTFANAFDEAIRQTELAPAVEADKQIEKEEIEGAVSEGNGNLLRYWPLFGLGIIALGAVIWMVGDGFNPGDPTAVPTQISVSEPELNEAALLLPEDTATPTLQPSPIPQTATDLPLSEETPLPTDTSIPDTPTPSATPTVAPQAGTRRLAARDGKAQRFVPAGPFEMGSDDPDAANDEQPIHTVFLDGYWIDETEVTNNEYIVFLNEIGGHVENCNGFDCISDQVSDPDSRIILADGVYTVEESFGNHPIVEVSWYGAQAYCEWAGRRLPTEAEWEKAARGTDGRLFPWGNEFEANLLNFSGDDRFESTAPVASYPGGASPFGAFDMAGNAWEWVYDWYDDDYYGRSPEENPMGPEDGTFKIIRGGAHFFRLTRMTFRVLNRPFDTFLDVGVRCVEDG